MNITILTDMYREIVAPQVGQISETAANLVMENPGYSGYIGGALTMFAISRLKPIVTPDIGESYREMIGRKLIRWIPSVEAMFREEVDEDLNGTSEKKRVENPNRKTTEGCNKKVIESWKDFGDPFLEIPDKALSVKELDEIVMKYHKLVNIPLQSQNYSGALYKKVPDGSNQEIKSLNDLLGKVQILFGHGNVLHPEFNMGWFLKFQIIQMISNLFGGNKEEVSGYTTEGGTKSNDLAMRIYREWGREEKGHKIGDGVIIIPKTAHASFYKAADFYGMTCVEVECDENGVVDLKEMESKLKNYGDKVVAIVGSAPSYPTGVVDDIPQMAKLALQYRVGFHVDCCLGAGMVNYIQNDANYLSIKGVTSLSADLHKYLAGEKGGSTLSCKFAPNLGNHHLSHLTRYGGHACPKWKGGIYGTSRDLGSEPIAKDFKTFLRLLSKSKEERKTSAETIQSKLSTLREQLTESFADDIEVLGKNTVGVVAFKLKGKPKRAIYHLTHLMKKKGFHLSNLADEKVHYCLTARSPHDFVEKFTTQLKDCLGELKETDEKDYKGEAGLYGDIQSELKPQYSEENFVQKWLFGPIGVKAMVQNYFIARLNPYLKEQLFS